MKRLVIFCIFILALTNQAYAMGSHHGGHGRSANVSSSGSGGSSTGGSDSGNSNTPTNPGNDSNTGGNHNVMPPVQNGPPNPLVPTPEFSTLFLLGAALFGVWGLRRTIKKLR